MLEDIINLLNFFYEKVPDKELNRKTLALVENKEQWENAHDYFGEIRSKTLKAEKSKNKTEELQYLFEEVCVKSIYNMYCYANDEVDPFDSDSPHWIIKNALSLAYGLGLAAEDVINIVAPNKSLKSGTPQSGAP